MIFCSKKGHQIYPLEIERIDKMEPFLSALAKSVKKKYLMS